MKTFKKLLVLFVLVFCFSASCSKEEIQTTTLPQCDCVKTYYLYYPAMGSGPSYIPARYEDVDQRRGKFNCSEETNGYVASNNGTYSHYKIECD